MKKVSLLTVLVLGLMFTANAQSENAAWVINPGEGQGGPSLGSVSAFGGLYFGSYTFVQTKDGSIRGTGHVKLEDGTPVSETTKFTGNLFLPTGFYPGALECILTPSGIGNCKFKVEAP